MDQALAARPEAQPSNFGNELDDVISRLLDLGRSLSNGADHLKGPPPPRPVEVSGVGALSRLRYAITEAEVALRRLFDE